MPGEGVTVLGLVVNLGLKSVRAITFDAEGRKARTSSLPVSTYLRDDWIEQEPEEWWTKTVACLREVTALGMRDFSFITVTASSACLVGIRKDGRPARRAIMVSDKRAVGQAAQLARMPAFSQLQSRAPGFAADPYYLLPKAMWLAQNEPEVHEQLRWLVTPADYIVYRLCGEVVTDPLNAEKFYYLVDAGRYPTELFEAAGVSAALLPPVRPVGETVGRLSAESAGLAGLRPGLPVVLTTYDAICAFWGTGVREPGDAADVSGTVTSVRVLSHKPAAADERRIFTQAMPTDAGYAIGGSNNLGGGLIEWLKQSFYADEKNPYEVIEVETAASDVGAHGLIFLPYLLGERCPVWDPNARGAFIGLERHHRRPEFARAVCESAAFMVQHILEVIRSQGVVPGRLKVSGGLARLRVVNEIKADVTGIPVDVVDEFETTSLGAYILASVGQGVFRSPSDGAGLVRVRESIYPNPHRHAVYRDWFALYLKLYDTLKGVFAERHGLIVAHQMRAPGKLENL